MARSGRGRDDSAGQAVAAVVGDAHRVVVVVEGDHHEHRPEDLLLGDGHGVVDVGEQRRLDEAALVEVRGPAAADDQRGRPRRCPSRCSRAPGRAAWRSTCGPWMVAGSVGSPYGDVLEDRLRRARRASSYRDRGSRMRVCMAQPWPPCIADASGGRQHLRLEVGVVEHDVGGLAAELEEHPLQRGGARRHDPPPGGGRPGERDQVDRAGRVASTSPTRWSEEVTMLTTPGGMSVCSAMSRPRRVAFHGVSGAGLSTTVLPVARTGPSLLSGDLEREVPRHDRADDADRLLPHLRAQLAHAERRPSGRSRSHANCVDHARPASAGRPRAVRRAGPVGDQHRACRPRPRARARSSSCSASRASCSCSRQRSRKRRGRWPSRSRRTPAGPRRWPGPCRRAGRRRPGRAPPRWPG